jgi:hypothetical protein
LSRKSALHTLVVAEDVGPTLPLSSDQSKNRHEGQMRSLKILPSFIILASLFGLAQDPAPAAATGDQAPAKVYVYRYKQFVGGALAPSVYCDEVQLARMDNGRYFTAILAPGKHTFRSNDKQSGMEWDLKPGKEYFLRVEIATGFMKGHGRLVVVPREQAGYELKSDKLKPLDAGKVADKTRVSVEEVHLVEPPPVTVQPAAATQGAKLVPAAATQSTVTGATIKDADGVVGTSSVSGEQISLGEASRRNKRPQPTR